MVDTARRPLRLHARAVRDCEFVRLGSAPEGFVIAMARSRIMDQNWEVEDSENQGGYRVLLRECPVRGAIAGKKEITNQALSCWGFVVCLC